MIVRSPFISSMAYVPVDAVPDLEDRINYLTLTVQPYEMLEHNYKESDGGPDEQTVHLFDRSKPGYIGFPREYAKEEFPHIKFRDITVNGLADRTLFPQTIKPRDEQQRVFMSSLANVCQRSGPVDVFAKARTGSGKLVTDLWLNAQLGIRTLVVVPTNKLKNQWLGSVKHKNGMRFFWGDEFVDKYVGIIQQDVCDYKDKLICVGLLPSLARRNYGHDVYRYFGKITFDEVHRCGAPMLANVLKRFHCRIRVGYTATARKDVLQRVINTHLGKPKVTSSQEVLKPNVFLHTFTTSDHINDYNEGCILTSVSELPDRNRRIAKIIANRYAKQRNILVLSDRTAQLVTLRDMVVNEYNISKEDIGLHVGSYETGKFKCTVTFVDGGKFAARVNSPESYKTKRDAYTWADGLRIPDRVLKKSSDPDRIRKEVKVAMERHKPTDKELQRITEKCRIILATYGIFAEGVDVPRIDVGIEATPRGNVEQAVGRVLRLFPGKPVPEWHSINDKITKRSSTFGMPVKTYDWFFLPKERARRACFERQKANFIVVGNTPKG